MYTGLKYPYIAQYNESTGAYTNGFLANKGVEIVMTPTFNSVPYPGDDQIVKQIDVFKNATVAAKVTSLPIAAATVMFGHTVVGTEIKRNTADKANYVGYGYTTTQVNDNGADTYIAKIIPKVKFMDGAETFTTNGDTITITAPQISGMAVADLNGDWLIEKTFDTEAEALAYVKSTLSIADQVANPTTSVAPGTYASTQSVVLSTATAGATIKYTTNGLTPSATVGTTYSTAISVATSTMVRAVAYKSGMAISNVEDFEYTITA